MCLTVGLPLAKTQIFMKKRKIAGLQLSKVFLFFYLFFLQTTTLNILWAEHLTSRCSCGYAGWLVENCGHGVKRSVHVCQFMSVGLGCKELLDKDDEKSAEYLDRQQSFVKNKLACSQSKSRWQTVYFSIIRGFFQIKGLCMESQRWKKDVVSQCEWFGLDVYLIEPQPPRLWSCKLSIWTHWHEQIKPHNQ